MGSALPAHANPRCSAVCPDDSVRTPPGPALHPRRSAAGRSDPSAVWRNRPFCGPKRLQTQPGLADSAKRHGNLARWGQRDLRELTKQIVVSWTFIRTATPCNVSARRPTYPQCYTTDRFVALRPSASATYRWNPLTPNPRRPMPLSLVCTWLTASLRDFRTSTMVMTPTN